MNDLESLIQQKINEIAAVSKDLPSVIVLHDIRTMTTVYMSERGLRTLNTTLEELREMGAEYFSYYFHPNDSKTSAEKIYEMIAANNVYDVFTMFQQVRISKRGEIPQWQQYFTTIKILLKDEFDKPVLTIASANALSAETSITNKTQRIIDERNFHNTKKHLFDTLTEREKELLKLWAQGATNSEISDLLSISIETVKTHRKNIKKKLEIQNSTELNTYAKAFDLI